MGTTSILMRSQGIAAAALARMLLTVVLVALVVLAGLQQTVTAQIARTGGAGSGSFSSLNITIPFVNDGRSTQAAGVPTHTFNQGFKDGDVCSGNAPVFKDGSTVQKFSASPPNARRYYPTACLMFALFQIVPT